MVKLNCFKKRPFKKLTSPKAPYQLGHWGEDLSCNYLKKKGFKILNRRFYTRFGEIDIIALKNNSLYFIEVKMRSHNHLAHPLMTITPKKIKRFKKAIQFYLLKHPEIIKEYTIQAVAFSIELKRDGKAHIEWIPFFL